MTEIWKPVLGYEGLYEISSIGRVKTLPKSVRYEDGRIRNYAESILSSSLSRNGYPAVGLTRKNKSCYGYK